MTSSPRNRNGVEEAIVALAARQHGVVTRAQLRAVGLSDDAVDRRLESKRLCALHRGVYLLGVMPAPRSPEMAAVLACGRSAVVSHRSSGRMWDVPLDRGRRDGSLVDVMVTDAGHRRRGVRLHRVAELPATHVTRLDGIPLTTPARTLVDLAATVPLGELERALAYALSTRLTNREELGTMLDQRGPTRGATRLRALLGSGRLAFTRSKAEERFLALVRRAQLPLPEVNVMVCDYEVDFFWRGERVVVEVDGFAFHASSRTFESDRRRDAVLAAAGMRVMRVTWHQVTKEPEALIGRLAPALALARAERG